MAKTLQVKRGLNSNLGALNLAAGEPAFVLDTGKLYIGDGTNKILINPDGSGTATKLATARTITLAGDVTGSISFDGSSDVTINTTEAASGVTAGVYTKVTVDAKGRITVGANLVEADIPSIHLAKIADAGTAAAKNVGSAAGQVPVLDSNGKLDVATIPAVAITDTFTVADQAGMLALTAQRGDVAIRTDLGETFILKADDATQVANWVQLLTPTSPVQSVNGKTGVVVITAADVGLGNVTNESKATMFTNAALTGAPTAPTTVLTDSSTAIATTAFVKSQGYLTANDSIDFGTF